ncbi:hypothetical protein M2G69_04290 [Vibrio vulnificus]|nr:hypothetical protein [Vibrio vulnificus]
MTDEFLQQLRSLNQSAQKIKSKQAEREAEAIALIKDTQDIVNSMVGNEPKKP